MLASTTGHLVDLFRLRTGADTGDDRRGVESLSVLFAAIIPGRILRSSEDQVALRAVGQLLSAERGLSARLQGDVHAGIGIANHNLILVPGTDNAFAPGAYALSMVYRRNISAQDPASVVLSQAGDTTDERAFVPLY